MPDVVNIDSRRSVRHIIFWSAPIVREGEICSLGVARRCIDATPDEIMTEARNNGGVQCVLEGGGYVIIPWPPACIEVKTTDKPIQSGWHQLA